MTPGFSEVYRDLRLRSLKDSLKHWSKRDIFETVSKFCLQIHFSKFISCLFPSMQTHSFILFLCVPALCQAWTRPMRAPEETEGNKMWSLLTKSIQSTKQPVPPLNYQGPGMSERLCKRHQPWLTPGRLCEGISEGCLTVSLGNGRWGWNSRWRGRCEQRRET